MGWMMREAAVDHNPQMRDTPTAADHVSEDAAARRVASARCYDGAPMPVQALCALQNGFMGAPRALLFYGDYSTDRVQIPVACYVIRTSDAVVLFDTGLSPRAIPGL